MSERKQTSKSVLREIEKKKKRFDSCLEKQKKLKEEMSELSQNIKELEKMQESLYQEELQLEIAKVWFKEEKLSNEQILKFLEISRQISDKIDCLDTKTVVKAVVDIYNSRQENLNSDSKYSDYNIEEKLTTNDIFLEKGENNNDGNK